MSAKLASSDALTSYLDQADAHGRLDADQEQAAARELVELRRACWKAALGSRALLSKSVKTCLRDADQIPKAWWTDAAHDDALITSLLELDLDRIALDDLQANDDLPKSTRSAIATARHRYQRARNTFMCHNLKLVVVVAKRFGRMHLSLADRVQEGNLGLIKAIDRFDPERGFRFSTYAAWWIRHTVTRALMKHGRTVRIPAHLHAVFNKVRLARPRLAAELGRPATVAEIAKDIDAPLARVTTAIEAMELRSVALDAPSGDPDSRTLGDVLPDERSEEWTARIERSVDVPLAERALDELNDKALDIVRHRYGLEGAEEKTLRELGQEYGVSRERIRQLQIRAIEDMRSFVKSGNVPSICLH